MINTHGLRIHIGGDAKCSSHTHTLSLSLFLFFLTLQIGHEIKAIHSSPLPSQCLSSSNNNSNSNNENHCCQTNGLRLTSLTSWLHLTRKPIKRELRRPTVPSNPYTRNLPRIYQEEVSKQVKSSEKCVSVSPFLLCGWNTCYQILSVDSMVIVTTKIYWVATKEINKKCILKYYVRYCHSSNTFLVYIYIYIYICVCVCVCVCARAWNSVMANV